MRFKIDFSNTKKKPKFKRPSILGDPGIPAQMHGTNPRTLMGKAWWDKQRTIAYKENNWCCWACGQADTRLEAHERYKYKKAIRRVNVTIRNIVGLCHPCHMYIHRGFLKTQLDKGRITKQEYNFIINRGRAIVHKHKIKYREISPRVLKTHPKHFRLIVEEKTFPAKFTNDEDRLKHYEKM